MKLLRLVYGAAALTLWLFFANEACACSMYKLTVDGKTFVGCNHDDWWITPKIWFENAVQPGHHGAAFTGAREMSNNRTAPQSGMNTAGLVFSRLASYHPLQENPFIGKEPITDEVAYLSEILHACATVEEVKRYIERFDYSYFISGVFIYIDKSGDYLIVEPYQLTEGNDPTYVLANFCPSITTTSDARRQVRYRNGQDFLAQHRPEASLAYCTALSDTMHVSRKRIGDGTLTTSIWNPDALTVDLFFYHDYNLPVQFALTEELAKGDHVVNIPDIFPPNAGFERMVSYKTPSNTPAMRTALVLAAGVLGLFSFLLVVAWFWKRNRKVLTMLTVVSMTLINSLLVVYLAVLATHRGVFYIDAPYTDPGAPLISASSYIPFLLALAFLPLLIHALRKLKSPFTATFPVVVVVLSNHLVYLFLMVCFGYWGFYGIW